MKALWNRLAVQFLLLRTLRASVVDISYVARLPQRRKGAGLVATGGIVYLNGEQPGRSSAW
jgi:hypothetical protein